jgi:archaea-specific DNA-binding protein
MTDNQAIFVGGKPFMNYVTAVVMQFTTKGADSVVIRSRGKFISRAVDVAEVVKSRFLRDQIEVVDIGMGSEEFKNQEGRTVRVSTLDINLARIAKKVEPVLEAPKAEPRLAAPKEEAKPAEAPAEKKEEPKAEPVKAPVAEVPEEEVEESEETEEE